MKKAILILLLIILLGGSIFIWSGVYNIAATDKHWAITNQLIEILRERSIEVRAKDIIVPDNLEDPARIAKGGPNYEAMCSSCHLAPGVKSTELYEGLYPQPPVFSNATHEAHDEKDNFWVIQNGLKLTGMPAWGGSHSDEDVWALVAFINRLDDMTAEEYKAMTAGGEDHHDDADEDSHQETAADEDSHEDDAADEDSHHETPADEAEAHGETTTGNDT